MMHKIFEVEPLKGEFSRAGEIVRVNDVSKHTNSDGMQHLNNLQSRASNVEQFQVELHLISDKAHQKYYNKNQELITYLAVMTNAANLRYLEMGNPKVKFLLVGVTRAKDHDFARNNGLYLVTGLDMTKIANGRKSNGILGRAYMSTVCSHMAMGEGEDTALSYNGVDTLAHELAHTLGSPHDETPECPWADGYLMSYVDGGLRKFRLSPCSQKSIRQYVSTLSPFQQSSLKHLFFEKLGSSTAVATTAPYASRSSGDKSLKPNKSAEVKIAAVSPNKESLQPHIFGLHGATSFLPDLR
ncbi:hypothetical protein MRX96_035069 [Rhipicephalus microplus]